MVENTKYCCSKKQKSSEHLNKEEVYVHKGNACSEKA